MILLILGQLFREHGRNSFIPFAYVRLRVFLCEHFFKSYFKESCFFTSSICGSETSTMEGGNRERKGERKIDEFTVVFGRFPPKFYRPFCPQHLYSTYVPKIRFTQATIDCVINNKSKNALHNGPMKMLV